jgi:hypothetical protein
MSYLYCLCCLQTISTGKRYCVIGRFGKDQMKLCSQDLKQQSINQYITTVISTVVSNPFQYKWFVDRCWFVCFYRCCFNQQMGKKMAEMSIHCTETQKVTFVSGKQIAACVTYISELNQTYTHSLKSPKW